MKFCPKCDIRLKKSSTNSVISCPKCGYNEGKESDIQNQVSEEESKSDFLVLDENEGKDTMPTIEIECEKCGNKLIDLWKVEKSLRTTKVQVKCENTNCGGSSLIVDMDGEVF